MMIHIADVSLAFREGNADVPYVPRRLKADAERVAKAARPKGHVISGNIKRSEELVKLVETIVKGAYRTDRPSGEQIARPF